MSVSIKELHEKTGELVRQAASAKHPVQVTDRGKVIAIIGSPKLLNSVKRPKRELPPEFLAFIKTLPRGDLQAEMDAFKGDR
jgi:prevent-host-death family protein